MVFMRADGSSKRDVLCVWLGTAMFFSGLISPCWLLVQEAGREAANTLNPSSSLNSSSSSSSSSSSCLDSTSDGKNSTCVGRRRLLLYGLWHKCSLSPFLCVAQIDVFSGLQRYLSLCSVLLWVSVSTFYPRADKLGVTVRNVRLTWDKAFPLGFFAAMAALTLTFLYNIDARGYEANSFGAVAVHLFPSFYLAFGSSLVIMASSFFVALDRRRAGSFCARPAVRTTDPGPPPRRCVGFQVVVQFPDDEGAADGIVQVPRLDGIDVEQLAKGRT